MKGRRDSQMARLHKKLQAEETSRVFARLADTFRRNDHLEEAIELCHRGLVHHPGYVSGHIVLGQCYLDLGRLEEARDSFVRALALDENNILTLRSLGNILFQQGELEEAAVHYRRALQLEPRNSDLQELLREAEARLAGLNAPGAEPESGRDPDSGEETDAAQAAGSLAEADVQAEADVPTEDDIPAEDDVPAGPNTGQPQGTYEEPPEKTDPPVDPAFSGTAMMSVPAFGREVLESTDTEEHRRWLREMTRGPEDGADDSADGVGDPQEEIRDPDLESPQAPSESGDPMPGAQLSPEETELLRDDRDEHTAKGPPRGMATATLAEIYFQQGYLDKAIDIYLKVLRHDPDDEQSRTRLSELRAMRSGRSEEPEQGEPSS